MNIRDRFGRWSDGIKNYISNKFNQNGDQAELYETRWVWYHTVLVIELFIIILLLLWIAI